MALGKVPEERGRWLGQVGAYTVGGAISSAALGATLGIVGSLIRSPSGLPSAVIIACVALACMARESFAPSSRIPQLRRQTPGRWAKTRRPVVAAFMWGSDIGLVFTTWFTFSGAWLVAVLALLSGSAAQGTVILLAYWSGRTLTVLLAPAMAVDAVHVPETLDAVDSTRRHMQLIHSVALAVCAALTMSAALAGETPLT